MNERKLKVQTVLGPVDSGSLGITLPHEHIIADARRNFFFQPVAAEDQQMATMPVNLENLGWIRANALSNLDCLVMPGEDILARELLAFREAGGGTIVDVSTKPLGGTDPCGLRNLAEMTGLHVIMGTGHYLGLSYSPESSSLGENDLVLQMTEAITSGIYGTGIRAGIIGEIGLTPNLPEDQRRLLRACARTQSLTGAPLTIHPPGSNEALIMEILELLDTNGGFLDRTVICHVDIMRFSRDCLHKVADSGCFIEFDTFGHLFPPFLLGESVMEFPSETQRLDMVQKLIADGYINHLLLSHDTFLKVQLLSYGGFGYSHLLKNIIPAMKKRGISEEEIHTITVSNPQKLLAFLE